MSDNSNEIRALYDKLCKEREEILALSTPLREQRDALEAEMHPLREKSKELASKFAEIEKPLATISRHISGLAQAMGGKIMAAEQPIVVKKSE